MSSFEEVINYTNDSLIKTVWYSEERQELMVELCDGECNTFYDVPPCVVERFRRASHLEEFYYEYIVEKFDSLPS